MRPRTLRETLRAYRIGDPAGRFPVWSAEGAKRTSGRWHEAGAEVIYASASYSTAMLEALVHWNGALPPNQHFIEVTIPKGTSYEVVTARHRARLGSSGRRSGPALRPRMVRGASKRNPDRPIGRRAHGTQHRHQPSVPGVRRNNGRTGNSRLVGPAPLPVSSGATARPDPKTRKRVTEPRSRTPHYSEPLRWRQVGVRARLEARHWWCCRLATTRPAVREPDALARRSPRPSTR